MEDETPHWKKIKALFESLKSKKKHEEITPLIAIYCFEPCEIREKNFPGIDKKTKEGKYKYFLNVFKFKEMDIWFYQALLEIEPANKKEETENYEKCFSSKGEMVDLVSFVSAPAIMFDSTNKKKKIITFKNTVLKFQELNEMLLSWKKEKTTKN